MPNENGNIPDNDVVVIDSLDSDALKNNLVTALAQKKHFREKAEREAAEKATLQAKIAEFEKNSKPQPLPTDEKPSAPKPAGLDQDSFLDNLEVFKNLDSGEITELRAEAKNLEIDPVKYIKSKAGQAHLKEFRAANKSKESTPTPSNKVPQFNGKSVDDILRDEKASAADKQHAFELKLRKGTNSSI